MPTLHTTLVYFVFLLFHYINNNELDDHLYTTYAINTTTKTAMYLKRIGDLLYKGNLLNFLYVSIL
jgi:hypothetical protein